MRIGSAEVCDEGREEFSYSDFFKTELLYWGTAPKHDIKAVHTKLRQLSAAYPGLFLFYVSGSSIRVLEKQNPPVEGIHFRVGVYLKFFSHVLKLYPISGETVFGFYLDDAELVNEDIPIFSFQKHISSKNLLFPDIDFLVNDFYDSPEFTDHLSFSSKRDSAIFVGATTGADCIMRDGAPDRAVTKDGIEMGEIPRINSALFFRRHENVIFKLPIIVQCDSAETEDLLHDLGFGDGKRIPLREQFEHKFIISMDGNGATCSRVALALKSNSVLLKYDSDSVLFYFRKLIPWQHFVPIARDTDVEEVVETARANSHRFNCIAENGTSFFRENLTWSHIVKYTASVIRVYSELIGPVPLVGDDHSTTTGLATGIGCSDPNERTEPHMTSANQPPSPSDAITLNEIGLATGTDKSSRHHGYLGFYESFFRSIREKPLKILEIGVYKGESVRMWENYFPRATVVGLDINPDTIQHASERVKIEIGSQNNAEDLVRIGTRSGPFDIILDDGSHIWSDQITSLQYLFPFVVRGGYYVVEDLQTSFPYDGAYECYRQGQSESAVQYLTRFLHYVLIRQVPQDERDGFLKTYAGLTEFIAFHYGTALIKKSG